MYCMKYFRIFILSPLARMIRVVLVLCRVYLPRSSFTYLDLNYLGFLSCCFSHLVSPVFLIGSYGVNVGMYIVAASYSRIYKYTNRIQARGGGGRTNYISGSNTY